MSRRMVVALIALAACNPHTTTRGDDDPGDADAAVEGPSTMTLDCEPFTRTERLADGRRYVMTTRWATPDGVDIDADFTVEFCDQIGVHDSGTTPCPAGATCTGASAPAGAPCLHVHRTGTFIDGRLAVNCSTLTETFAANGTMTERSEWGYRRVRLRLH